MYAIVGEGCIIFEFFSLIMMHALFGCAVNTVIMVDITAKLYEHGLKQMNNYIKYALASRSIHAGLGYLFK